MRHLLGRRDEPLTEADRDLVEAMVDAVVSHHVAEAHGGDPRLCDCEHSHKVGRRVSILLVEDVDGRASHVEEVGGAYIAGSFEPRPKKGGHDNG